MNSIPRTDTKNINVNTGKAARYCLNNLKCEFAVCKCNKDSTWYKDINAVI
jgi:hypothetical protein